MLDDFNGSDLAGLVDRDRNLHRLEASHLINRRVSRSGFFSSGFFSRGFLFLLFFQDSNAIGSRSSLDGSVDRIRGHSNASLDVDLAGRKIKTNQRRKRFLSQQIRAKARRLAMLRSSNGSDLAVGNFNIKRQLLEALHGVGIARDNGLAASRSSSLLERIVDALGGHGDASLDVDLSGSDVLTNQGIKTSIDKIRAEARGLAMLGHGNRNDLARVVNFDRNLHRAKASDIVDGGAGRRSRQRQRLIDAVGSHGHASLNIDLSGRDILTDQRIKACSDQIRAEARRLVVLKNRHGSDLASIINSNLDLHRTKAVDIVSVCRDNRLSRLAGSGGSSGQNGLLIARVGRDAQHVLGMRENVLHAADESRGRNSRAADGVHVVREGIRISRNSDELIHERRFGNLRAQTSGLRQSADIGLSHIAFSADTDGDRDRSAVALRVGNKRITGNVAGFVGRGKHLSNLAALRKTFNRFDLCVGITRKNLIQRFHLRSDLLFSDRSLGHFVGQRQRDGSNESEQEQSERKLHDITHSSCPPQSS